MTYIPCCHQSVKLFPADKHFKPVGPEERNCYGEVVKNIGPRTTQSFATELESLDENFIDKRGREDW